MTRSRCRAGWWEFSADSTAHTITDDLCWVAETSVRRRLDTHQPASPHLQSNVAIIPATTAQDQVDGALEHEVHRRVRGVLGEPRAVVDRDMIRPNTVDQALMCL